MRQIYRQPEPARLWHLPSLLRILWAGTRGREPVQRRRDEDLLLLAKLVWRRQVMVLRQKGRVAAFIARDGARIHGLYTAPLGRGQGAGAALLHEAKAASAKLELWCAQANTGARRFYAAHGFKEARLTSGEGNDEGLPDVQMMWERPNL